MKLLESFTGIFGVPDLRRKIIFTLCALAIYRIGANVALPGVDPFAFEEFFRQKAGTILDFLNVFSGGGLSRFSVFAMGLAPYITASIAVQFMTKLIPYLESLHKEGELGRKKINRFALYLTVPVCLAQSLAMAFTFEQFSVNGRPLVYESGWAFRSLALITLTAGTLFLVWLGNQITERGIGNGISLIIFAGIVSGLPKAVYEIWLQVELGTWHVLTAAAVVCFMALVTATVVYVEKGVRRIPVHYPRKISGRRLRGANSNYLPLKINPAGVVPIIFAASLLYLPQTLTILFHAPWIEHLGKQLRPGYPLYVLLYSVAILFFTYLYVGMTFNPDDIADSLKKAGAYIPGIRPGRPTAKYLDPILSRLAFIGSLYLIALSLLPDFLTYGFKVQALPLIGPRLEEALPSFLTTGIGLSSHFGGISLLIVIGVVMELVQQIEAHLIMRHYESFSLTK